MLTQLATQIDIATQTVQYANDLSALMIGLFALLGVSASMIVVTTLQVRFIAVVRLALAIRRLHRAQASVA
jgi:hypothetical protein